MIAGLVALARPAKAGDANFGAFVKGIERDFGVKRTHIPMFWLAKTVVRVGKPHGCSQLDLAVFEDQDLSRLASAPDLRGRLHRLLGDDWTPWVEVTARQEQTYLYMRGRGRDVQIVVFTVERDEATAVLLRVDPDMISRAVADPEGFARSRDAN